MLIASINRQLTIALTVSSLVALLALGAAEHFRDVEYDAIQQNYQAAKSVDQLLHSAQSLNEVARGYVSTGQTSFLTAYQDEIRKFEEITPSTKSLEALSLLAEEMQYILSIHNSIASAMSLQKKAINLAREHDFSAAVSLLYSDDYKTIRNHINDAAQNFSTKIDSRFSSYQEKYHQYSFTGRIIAIAMGGLNMILLIYCLLFFYRKRVIFPITQLVEDLKQVQNNEAASFRNQDLSNEIGNVVRAIQNYHATAREAKGLRWAADSKSAIMASCQECLSAQAFAQHLSSSLARALNCGAVATHMRHIRTGRYYMMGSFGGPHDTSSHHEESPFIRQAIFERQILELRDIPPGYMHVRSGTGDSSPRILYVFPLLHGSDGLGAIEIACFTPLTVLQIQLITETGSALTPLIERLLVSNILDFHKPESLSPKPANHPLTSTSQNRNEK